MRFYLLAVLMLVAAVSVLSEPAKAAPTIDCSGKAPDNSDGEIFKLACKDADLIALDRRLADGFAKATVAAKDPLLMAALRLEERRRQLVSENADRADTEHATAALDFLKAGLERQKAILAALAKPPAPGIAGEWANAHASLKAEPIGADGYRLTFTNAHVESAWGDVSIGTCTISVDVKRRADGWYQGPTKASDRTPTRVIRQGPVLAVALGTADRSADCGRHEAITGPYFRLSAAPELAVPPVAAPVLPYFDCATEKGKEETCLDPELAGLDRDLNRAFADAIKRVSPETAKYLRQDQRDWLKLESDMVEDALSPTSSKLLLPLNNFGDGRTQAIDWLRGRIAMLDAVEARRDGFIGDWMSSSAFARITPSKRSGLFVSAEKAGFYYHAGDCDYVAWAKVHDGILAAKFQPASDPTKAGRRTPEVWSNGQMLTLDADYPALDAANDKANKSVPIRATYCTRRLDPDARLFPIRSDAKGVTPTFDSLTDEDNAQDQIDTEEAD
ncbi:MAG: hypothetical protein P4L98_14930 [Ancalomicrobiaceae bacterium]|nr:hypothetical protein [Ancalomicrobiaceae bacterium]